MRIVVPFCAEQRLEIANIPVAPGAGRLVDELVDPRDQHVLVMRAVEDDDLAALPAHAGGRARESRARLQAAVGCLKLATSTPCGLTPLNTCLIVPSLPPASIACSTTRTECLRSA